MAKTGGATINVTGTEDVPTEVLASAIVRISEASQKLLSSGLNRRALELLLKDACGVPLFHIGAVLNALPRLAELYTVPKPKKARSGK